ncbi:hypothetical protein FRX31_029147 [Thalictrum thalictroides]|uniref:F-box associated domain-containing protein n=1 Tax=Thalictrum thalictroides TaxID=46969 RepID=A0A7J6VAR9_THATH|nr:hypothetical protein FRX31_029147 [Thalictrum thalictroides]
MIHPTSGSELILALDINNEKFHTLQLPPVKLPAADFLSLINFAGNLAFVQLNTLACSSQIWKIVSSETNDRWICKYTCKHVSEMDYCTVLGLSDRNLLYKATQFQRESDDQLGLYTPEKKESFLLKMHGSPHKFHTVLFAPTFISPIAIYFPSKLMWNRRIFTKLVSRLQKQASQEEEGRKKGAMHKEEWQVEEIQTEQKVYKKNDMPSWFTRSSYFFSY